VADKERMHIKAWTPRARRDPRQARRRAPRTTSAVCMRACAGSCLAGCRPPLPVLQAFVPVRIKCPASVAVAGPSCRGGGWGGALAARRRAEQQHPCGWGGSSQREAHALWTGLSVDVAVAVDGAHRRAACQAVRPRQAALRCTRSADTALRVLCLGAVMRALQQGACSSMPVRCGVAWKSARPWQGLLGGLSNMAAQAVGGCPAVRQERELAAAW